MKKFALLAALAALGVALAATAALARPAATTTAGAQAVSCNSTLKLAIVTPLTGGAGFLGQEQLLWAKYAVATLPKTLGLKIQLVTGDTPVEQGNAPAQSVAQKFVADKNVIAIIGPSTSGAVAASSKTYHSAGLAHVSPSATRTSLTRGPAAKREATASFFRVVPGDHIQGPSDAKFMIEKLKVKKVVVMDFQEPYSLGLAAQVTSALRAKGVAVSRLSAPNMVTDFSSYVTRVPNDANIVFFPTQKPADAQTFAKQLVEQGKRAKVFGGDGSNDSSQFKAAGSYVSNFAPDITALPGSKSVVAGFRRANPGKPVGSFGPPTYGAVQVVLNAIRAACSDGNVERREVVAQVKKVKITKWLLGGTFSFLSSTNDPTNAKFYIFQIQSNGKYKLVG